MPPGHTDRSGIEATPETEDRMPPSARTCSVRGTPFHYTEMGTGIPLLALAGSPGDSHQTIGTLEPAFVGRRGWRRIHLDLPGTGGTPAAAWVDTQDMVVQAVLEFLDAVVGDEPVALAGISYGSTVVTALRHRQPERVLATLHLSPGNDLDPEAESTPVVVEDLDFVTRMTVDERPFLDMFKVRTAEVLTRIRRWTMPGVASSDLPFLDRLHSGPRFAHLSETPHPFPGPVLVVTGRQDPGGYGHLVAALEFLPRATFALLDRAGHLAFAEQPGLVDALVREWLDRVEEYQVLTHR